MLEVSAERAWEEVQRSRLLAYVSWPLLTFEPVAFAPIPPMWTEGTHEVKMRGFGLIPLGLQKIVISRPAAGPQIYQIRDNGSGDLVSRWDHLITITPAQADRCLYRDDVEIRAGVLTPLMWAFAWLLYTHRQRRWRKLVSADFAF
jgi:hypothetical protein